MIRPILIAAALLLVAGCTPRQPDDSPQAECERQAESDPTVKDIITKGAGSEHYRLEHQAALRLARQDATLRCLRTRGLAPRGGVERQRGP